MSDPYVDFMTEQLARLETENSELREKFKKAEEWNRITMIEIENLRSLNADMETDSCVPCQWTCHTCGFQLAKNFINPNTGDVGGDNSEAWEVCPNDGERMERLTWKQHAEEMCKVCESQIHRAAFAEEIVTGLRVELKELEKAKEIATGLMFVCFAEANRIANHGHTDFTERELYAAANEAKATLETLAKKKEKP